MGSNRPWPAKKKKEAVMTAETKLPPEEVPEVPAPEEHKLIDELQKMAYEELLPVEKKLIGWSILIGIVALGLLVLIRYAFLPAVH
jgi:hypothetical protein